MAYAFPSGSRRLAWVASAAAIGCAAALAVYAASQADPAEPQPPQLVARGLVSSILLGAPGVIGAVGAATGRPAVLAAAGVLCLVQSFVAFSGVTLVYLFPGLAFLRAASGTPHAASMRFGLRSLLITIALVPVGVLIGMATGVLGLLGLLLVAGIAAGAWRGLRRVPPQDAIHGAAIVVLLVCAWAASFAFVDTACWIGREAAGGGITWERIPPTTTLTLGPGELISTCRSDELTATGALLGGGLVLAAVLLSAWPPLTRRTAGDRSRSAGASPG